MHTPAPVWCRGETGWNLCHPSPSGPCPQLPPAKPKEWLSGLLANDGLTQVVRDRDIPGWPHFLGPVMVSVLTKDNVSQSFRLLRRALLYRDAETLGSRASLGPGVGGWGSRTCSWIRCADASEQRGGGGDGTRLQLGLPTATQQTAGVSPGGPVSFPNRETLEIGIQQRALHNVPCTVVPRGRVLPQQRP